MYVQAWVYVQETDPPQDDESAVADARFEYAEEGRIEFDDDPEVSR